jgi:hypothetical protein
MQVATRELTQISLRSGAGLEALTVICLTDRYSENNTWTAEHRERLSSRIFLHIHPTRRCVVANDALTGR